MDFELCPPARWVTKFVFYGIPSAAAQQKYGTVSSSTLRSCSVPPPALTSEVTAEQ